MAAEVSRDSRPDLLNDKRVSESRAAEIIGVSLQALQRKRRKNQGPRYLRLSPCTVIYNESDLRDYLLDKIREGQAS